MHDPHQPAAAKAIWIGLTLAAALISCGEPESAVITQETGDGPVITNLRSVEEIPAGRLQLLWRYQSEEWIDPSDVELDGGDRVAIADPRASRVYVIGAEGEEVHSWGRRGEGPGEWPGVVGLLFHDGEVWVQPTTSDVERFGPEGEQRERLELAEPLNLLAANDSLLIGRSRVSSNRLVLIDPSDGTLVHEVRVAPIERYPSDQYGSCWRLAATHERVYRLSCAAGRIEVLDLAGERVTLIELADEPRASTDAELDAYVERFWDARSDGRSLDPLVQRQLEGVRDAAAILPRYAALRVDPRSGRLILLDQPFGDDGIEDPVLHVLSPEGRHLRRIEGEGRVRDFAVVGDTVALLVRDPVTGLIELQVHLLRLEPDGP